MQTTLMCRLTRYSCGIMVILALSGCSQKSATTKSTGFDGYKALPLSTYSNCEELVAEAKSILLGQVEQRAREYEGRCQGNIVPMATPDVAAGNGRESSEVTATNVQEAGVDEADLMKSENGITAAIVGTNVVIARNWPIESFGRLATIAVSGTPQGLYLVGGKLVVLSQQGSNSDIVPMAAVSGSVSVMSVQGSEALRVKEEVYDLADPAQPKLIKQQEYAGTLLSSRRLGNALVLVLEDTGIVMPAFDEDLGVDWELLPECPKEGISQPNQVLITAIERYRERARAAIEAATLQTLLPHVNTDGAVACTQVSRSGEAAGSGLLTIAHDRFQNASQSPSLVAILGNGGAAYMSPSALYVASGIYPWDIWSAMEAENATTYDRTVIHRFGITETGLAYSASGKVEGLVVDNGFAGSRYSSRFSMASFSMSEYQGLLRIATTKMELQLNSNPGWFVGNQTPPTESLVTVLQTNGSDLSEIGKVDGLGKGEYLRAVRFIGDRGYVVTFQKTDPLYVIDLSTPAQPTVVGELKIPGFSTYLHPMSEGKLMGLGFDAEQDEGFAWTQGVKLALYDVSQPQSPTEIGHRVIGGRGSYTPAVEEHHAFTYDASRKLIALPIDVVENGSGEDAVPTTTFSGVMLLRADDTGSFGTVGQISVDFDDSSDGVIWPTAYPSAGVMRTALLGDTTNAAVLILTQNDLRMNRVDAGMTSVGIVR